MVNIASLLTSGAIMMNLYYGSIIYDRASLVGTSRTFFGHRGSLACLIKMLNHRGDKFRLLVWFCRNPVKLLDRDQVRLQKMWEYLAIVTS